MKKTMIVLGIGLVLAAGCTAPPEYYRALAERTELQGDTYLRRDADRYAPQVVLMYTRQLSQLPHHPVYEPIRRRLEQKREEAKRYTGGSTGHWGSQDWATSVEDVPRFQHGGPSRRASVRELERTPAVGSREPRTGFGLNLALSSLTGRFDCEVNGRCLSVSPELAIETRLGEKWSRFSLAGELRGGIYSGDIERDPFGPPAETSCRISHFSMAIIGCAAPSRRAEKRFEFLMGWKFTHLGFRGPAGYNSESYQIPAFCFGFRFRVHMAKGFTMIGTFRPNFFIWTRDSVTAGTYGLDAGVRAFIRLQDRLDLCLGVEWEGLSYSLNVSEGRDKRASLDNEKYFLGLRFNF